jgi:hypothetical protein
MNKQQIRETYIFLSKNILNVLAKEDFDRGTIFTFCVYLFFSVIKAGGNCFSTSKVFSQAIMIGLTKQFDHRQPQTSPRNTTDSYLLEDLDKSLLSEICADLWSDGQIENLLWAKKWQAFCKDMLDGSRNRILTGLQLINVISDHLEYSEGDTLNIFNVVNETISLK